MKLNLSIPETTELKPRITVVGLGGAGGNAVNNMITSGLEGVEFVVANTDAQALSTSMSQNPIQLGVSITHGLGAGARPEIGRVATEEGLDEILGRLEGSHMLFIAAGMGGGTGTGGAPVIARAAREQGILTVGVVTKPFQFEGVQRMRSAEAGIQELQQYVDTLIVIPNQNLFRIANEKTTFADAFKMADDVLHSGVRGVTDLMVMPGLINLDFADVRTVMGEMGKAMMGTGEAKGEKRAIEAAEAAINNPLLDDMSMQGARGVLINITGGTDMTLFEVDEAANRIRDEVDPEASIIFGSTFEDSLEGTMRVSLVATGIDADAALKPKHDPSDKIHVLGLATRGGAASGGAKAVDESAPAAEAPREVEATIVSPAVSSSGGAVALAIDPTDTETAAAGHRKSQPAASPVPAAGASVKFSVDPAPAAMPAKDAFIAPPPVEPQYKPERLKAPEPFAEAAMANGGTGLEKRVPSKAPGRGPSLFERMTRTGRARGNAAAPEPESSQRKSEPVLDEATQSEPATPPSGEEDFLDIPAFLRRQAN